MDRIEGLTRKVRFVHAAARRARQLQTGAQPTIPASSRKPTRIAMEEVLQDKVTYEVVQPEEPQQQPEAES